MKRSIITASVIALIAGGAVVAVAQTPSTPNTPPQAQQQTPSGRFAPLSAEDRAAVIDSRIAGFKALLRLTPDQERLWPPVEAAVREAAQQRFARMAQMREMRQQRQQGQAQPDPVTRLRAASDRMAEGAASMRKIADAAQPLYASLDAAQKARIDRLMSRRFMRFAEGGGPGGMMERGGMMGHGGRGGGSDDGRRQ